MESKKNRKTKRITLRLTESELEQISKKCKVTTCRKLSEYVRLVLFARPVTIVTRDGSADQAMGEIIHIRTELNRIGANTNQVAKRLHALTEIHEFREHLQQQQAHHSAVRKILEEALSVINKLADRWLR